MKGNSETKIRYRQESHRADVSKDNHLELPSRIEILVWGDGVVQIGNAEIGKYLDAERLEVGEMAKANLVTYVVAIKRVAEDIQPVHQAKILRLPKRTRVKTRSAGKAVVIKLH